MLKTNGCLLKSLSPSETASILSSESRSRKELSRCPNVSTERRGRAPPLICSTLGPIHCVLQNSSSPNDDRSSPVVRNHTQLDDIPDLELVIEQKEDTTAGFSARQEDVWARLKRGKEWLLEGCDPNPSLLKVHNKLFIAKQAKRVGVGHV
jgi:hypothetical protein